MELWRAISKRLNSHINCKTFRAGWMIVIWAMKFSTFFNSYMRTKGNPNCLIKTKYCDGWKRHWHIFCSKKDFFIFSKRLQRSKGFNPDTPLSNFLPSFLHVKAVVNIFWESSCLDDNFLRPFPEKKIATSVKTLLHSSTYSNSPQGRAFFF